MANDFYTNDNKFKLENVEDYTFSFCESVALWHPSYDLNNTLKDLDLSIPDNILIKLFHIYGLDILFRASVNYRIHDDYGDSDDCYEFLEELCFELNRNQGTHWGELWMTFGVISGDDIDEIDIPILFEKREFNINELLLKYSDSEGFDFHYLLNLIRLIPQCKDEILDLIEILYYEYDGTDRVITKVSFKETRDRRIDLVLN